MDINVLALAYIGDAIYEIYVRDFLIKNKIVKVKDLQEKAVLYVSANAQSKFLKEMIEKEFFSKEEMDVLYRARNHKSRKSKSTDITTYKHSTALEALIGYLYYAKNKERIEEIMNYILED